MSRFVYLVIANSRDEPAEVFGVYESREDAEKAIRDDFGWPRDSRTGAYRAHVEAAEWHGEP